MKHYITKFKTDRGGQLKVYLKGDLVLDLTTGEKEYTTSYDVPDGHEIRVEWEDELVLGQAPLEAQNDVLRVGTTKEDTYDSWTGWESKDAAGFDDIS